MTAGLNCIAPLFTEGMKTRRVKLGSRGGLEACPKIAANWPNSPGLGPGRDSIVFRG
jgi:hypothetical protein